MTPIPKLHEPSKTHMVAGNQGLHSTNSTTSTEKEDNITYNLTTEEVLHHIQCHEIEKSQLGKCHGLRSNFASDKINRVKSYEKINSRQGIWHLLKVN